MSEIATDSAHSSHSTRAKTMECRQTLTGAHVAPIAKERRPDELAQTVRSHDKAELSANPALERGIK